MVDWSDNEELFLDPRYEATLETIRALRTTSGGTTSVSPEAAIGLRVYQGLVRTMWVRRMRNELELAYAQTLVNLQLQMQDVAILIGDEASEFEDEEMVALMHALTESLEESDGDEFNSPAAIELVAPAHKVADGTCPDKCSICIAEIQHPQLYRELTCCSHRFHKMCIDEWFRRKLTCPLCRTSLV